jgi:alpha-amylase
MQGRVQLFDVPLHNKFFDASKQGKDFNLSEIFNDTLVQTKPEFAVTFVDNHDTQPGQSLESFVDFWFKPHANALILLRQQGIPCVFYASYYGASYNVGEDKIELAPVPHLYKMLKIRQQFLEGEQNDYFDHPNIIAWCNKGTEQNTDSGFVVVLSNNEDGFKEINLGKHNGGKSFVDVTESFKDAVTTNEEGVAIFPVKERSISIWMKNSALDKIK